MGFRTLVDGLLSKMLWPIRFISSLPPRTLLFSYNLAVCLCSVVLTFCSVYVASLFYIGEQSATGNRGTDWITWLGLGIIGLMLTATCIIGMRGAVIVSLDLLLIYFWAIVVFVAPLLLGTIACFDFYLYMEVYFRHRWEFNYFSEVRKLFCAPGTSDSKCMAPLGGGRDFESVTDWCLANFNSTDCQSIRDTAESNALLWGEQITLSEGIVGTLNLVMIFASLYLCYRILTSPVITQSMNDIISYLLLIPIGGCAGMGIYLSWMAGSDIDYDWLSTYFIVIAIVQFFQIPVGVYAGRQKRYYLLTFYILLVLSVSAAVVAAGIFCMLFSVVLPETFIPSESLANKIACDRNLVGCCCCDVPDDGQVHSTSGPWGPNNEYIWRNYTYGCPEWSTQEIVDMTAIDIKMAGLVAFLSLLYLIGALVVAGLLRENLKNYKTEYV